MTEVTVTRGALPADRFSIIENHMVRGKLPIPIKVMARCILLHLLSLPSGWKTTRADLDSAFVEGRDAVTAGITELRNAGYLVTTRTHTTSGTWAWSWAVTDDPIQRPLTGSPSTESQSMVPTSGNKVKPLVAPSTGSPSMVNPSIKEEDGCSKKTKKTTSSTSSSGAPADVAAADQAEAAVNDFWQKLPSNRRPGTTKRNAARTDVQRLLAHRTADQLVMEVLADWPTGTVPWPGSLVIARLERLTDAPDTPAARTAIADELTDARNNRDLECGHGTPGGLHIRSDTGQHLCPNCRAPGNRK